MRVATALGLSYYFDSEAARLEREMIRCKGHPHMNINEMTANIHRARVAAYALRSLTTEQEIDLLEWQFGGPDGIGTDSYPNPITVLRPPPPKLEPRRSWWQKIRDPLGVLA